MALYSYVHTKHRRTHKKLTASIVSLLLITSGVLVLIWVLYPILTFELFFSPKFAQVVRPVPNDSVASAITKDISYVLGSVSIDYTKASSWFPKAQAVVSTNISQNGYTLSIPKLSINNASVKIGGDDLAKSLIHFAGPLPGNVGNPVILGHSTLPLLYKPTDYKAIFTKLPSLEQGDTIIATVDNVTYTYSVSDMKIVAPDDVSVLAQQYENATLTLITCVPPGTYLKRLIITAKLVTQ